MAFLEKLRTRVGNYFLNKEVTKINHARTILNLSEARTVGMVFNANNGDEVEIVKEYCNYLTELGKKVQTIGYISAKDSAAAANRWSGQNYVTRKEINGFYKPGEQFMSNFVKEPFDLLIDANIDGSLPLMFVTALSKARCKVGRYSEKYLKIYDVMIETGENKTIKYFLKNVDTYMEMLNNKKVVTV